jgi:hypothetical protein
LVFGCAENVAKDITGRIYNSEDAWAHPILIMGILAEIERERHMQLVEQKYIHLLKRVRILSKSEEISSVSMMSRENYSVELWIEVSQLRIALEMWKEELCKMQAHTSELDKIISPVPEHSDNASYCPSDEKAEEPTMAPLSTKPWQLSARDTGPRIRKRLAEIISEYDHKIRECKMVLDGMALSAQLVRF